VSEVFEIPLAFVMNIENLKVDTRGDRKFYAYTYNTYYIWGATAGMLKNLRDRLHA
jgi:hypothetical protein